MRNRPRVLYATIGVGIVLVLGLLYVRYPHAARGDGGALPVAPSGGSPQISPTATVWEMVAQVNGERALKDLRRLTGEEPVCAGTDCHPISHRLTGSEELRLATDYIVGELIALGYAVELRTWSRAGYSDRNVVARKAGARAPAEEVYFVAHLDGVRPAVSGRFPAADDDASGVVDNLELARVLSSHTFSRTVVLLFTTGEEQGALGARSYLDQLSPAELHRITYAVDLDMVGYDANRDGVMELWHGAHAPSLAVTQMMRETIRAYRLDLAPRLVVGCG